MVAAPKTINVDPESELARLLTQVDEQPIVLINDGIRYLVTRDARESDDSMDSSLGDSRMDRIREIAGIITPEEAEQWKANIYRWREEGTRPLDKS